MERDQTSEQNWNSMLSELYKEFQEVKTHNSKLERRLLKIESAIEGLSLNIKALIPEDSSIERDLETVDKYITEYIQAHSEEQEHDIDIEGVNSNWNYFVAQKGGFDEVLYMTMLDLLKLSENSVELLTFLFEKRKKEVDETLHQLQEEFQRLEGNKLQQHFKNLWALHHDLLKKKMVRTWKEEVFLEAFETFISWLQR